MEWYLFGNSKSVKDAHLEAMRGSFNAGSHSSLCRTANASGTLEKCFDF